MPKKLRNQFLILMISFAVAPYVFASNTATITIGGVETQISGNWDTGQLSISFIDSVGHVYTETASYGEYSTAASVASYFGAKFSNDYFAADGLCAYAVGAVITFHLKGGATLNFPSITNSSHSFSISPGISITSILPDPSAVGTTVTIYGGPFGASQGSSTVTFNGVLAIPSSWSDNAVVLQVPAGAATGDVVVTVSGYPSSGFLFIVPAVCP